VGAYERPVAGGAIESRGVDRSVSEYLREISSEMRAVVKSEPHAMFVFEVRGGDVGCWQGAGGCVDADAMAQDVENMAPGLLSKLTPFLNGDERCASSARPVHRAPTGATAHRDFRKAMFFITTNFRVPAASHRGP
jgi:hypothetical protein